MTEKIDPGLFARLMQMSAPTRSDLLEYIGQGAALPEPAYLRVRGATEAAERAAHQAGAAADDTVAPGH